MTKERHDIIISEKGARKAARNIKGADNSLVSMGKAAVKAGLLFFGARGLIQGFKYSVRVGKEFEQTMANVKAITGATGAAFVSLERDALRLGGTTKFTASQVADLQTEFGRLGFTTKEILKVTEATLDLAAATGEGLAESATVAGGTIRAFNLDASETGRVTDVMTKSFSSSALDLTKFTESMKVAAPVAGATGFKIEGTTAILGTLSDRMVDSSLAGTALRRIFLELSNENSRLAKRMGGSVSSVEELVPALNKLKEEGISTAEITELVGLRAVTAFQVMVDSADDIDTLRKSLMEAGGAAKKMAEIQLDTLEGKMLILKSATEDLGISFSKKMNPFVEDSVVFLTRAASAASEFFKRTTETSLETTIRELQGLGISTLNLELAFARATDAKLKFASVGLRGEEEISKNLENSLNLRVGLLQEQGRIQSELLEQGTSEEELRKQILANEFNIIGLGPIKAADHIFEVRKLREAAELKLAEIELNREILLDLEQQNLLDQTDLEIIQKKEAAAAAVLALETAIEESKKNQVSFTPDTKGVDDLTKSTKFSTAALVSWLKTNEEAVESGLKGVALSTSLGDASRALANQYIVEGVFAAAKSALESVPFPLNLLVATAAAAGANALFSSIVPTKKAEHGFEGFVDRPTVFMTGEGNKREHVSITPLESQNINGPSGGSTTIININGGIVDQDYVVNVLQPALNRASALA